MSDASDTPQFSQQKSNGNSGVAIANATRLAIGLHEDGHAFELPARLFEQLPFAILHELTTNAVKYGALSVPSGRLRVEWSRGEAEIVIRWTEADGPAVREPTYQGFGTRVSGPVVQKRTSGQIAVRLES
jgi:two-component sensor histidine kinase